MTFTAIVVLTVITLVAMVLLTTLALVVVQERRQLRLPDDSVSGAAPPIPELA